MGKGWIQLSGVERKRRGELPTSEIGEKRRGGLSVGVMGEKRRRGYCFDNQAVMIEFTFTFRHTKLISFPSCNCRRGFLHLHKHCVTY